MKRSANKKKLLDNKKESKPPIKEKKSEQSPIKEMKSEHNLSRLDWIVWKENSCRYDSFLTVFCLVIFNKNPEVFTKLKNKNEEMKKLMTFCEHLNELDFEKRFEFWKCRENKKLDGEKSTYLKIGYVSSLFSVFFNISANKVLYNYMKSCDNCKFFSKVQRKTGNLLGLNADMNAGGLENESLRAKIEKFFASTMIV